MWCGNNEDCESPLRLQLIEDQQIEQWSMDTAGDPLPARVIYEQLLPNLVKELVDPVIPYWPGSPYGGEGWDTADPTVGDVVSPESSDMSSSSDTQHQWDVWGGKETNYMDWDRLGGRFVSEFGLPSFPDRRTVDLWLDGDASQAYPQSKLMQQHNKAGSYERRFATVMNENFRLTGDLTE
jgi:beta-mannosidase